MKNLCSNALFIILLYVLLFNPPLTFLGGVNLGYVLIIISLYVILQHNKEWTSYFRFFHKEIMLFSIVATVSVFRSGLMGDYMYIVRHILSILYIAAVIPTILILSKMLRAGTANKIIKGILIASSIAGFFSLLCTIIPSFNEYVKSTIIKYQEEDYLFGNIRRGFGLADGLTSSYAYIQGTIAAFGLYYIKEYKWLLFIIPIIFLSALVNARTGVLISFWGFLSLIIAKKRSALILAIIISVGFIYYLENILKSIGLNEFTIAWILDFQDQLDYIASGDLSNGTTNTMSSMIIWPSGALEWLLGSGVDLFNSPRVHSDIGWFIQLNYGGLLYVLPLYYAFYFMSKRLLKNGKKAFALMFIGAALIVNTKSKIFPTTSFFPFLFLLYVLANTKMKAIWQQNKSKHAVINYKLNK